MYPLCFCALEAKQPSAKRLSPAAKPGGDAAITPVAIKKKKAEQNTSRSDGSGRGAAAGRVQEPGPCPAAGSVPSSRVGGRLRRVPRRPLQRRLRPAPAPSERGPLPAGLSPARQSGRPACLPVGVPGSPGSLGTHDIPAAPRAAGRRRPADERRRGAAEVAALPGRSGAGPGPGPAMRGRRR